MKSNITVLRKGLIFILTLVLVMQSGVCVFAQEENSNTETCSGWAKAEVAEAIGKGLVPEALQRDYQKPVTRRELAELSAYYFLWHEPEGTSMEEMWEKRDAEFAEKRQSYDNGDAGYYRYYQENIFSDTNDECVNRLYQFRFINGFPDGTFRPEIPVTRAQAAVMLWDVRNAYYVIPSNVTFPVGWMVEARDRFTDIPKELMWYEIGMSRLYVNNIMTGISETFYGVDQNLTREQAIVTMLRMTKSERY